MGVEVVTFDYSGVVDSWFGVLDLMCAQSGACGGIGRSERGICLGEGPIMCRGNFVMERFEIMAARVWRID